MLASLKNVAKVPDLRKKILFTVLMIALFRVGTRIPVPGVDFDAVKELTEAAKNADGGILPLLQLFSGGALTQFAVFALGVGPYITASIIIQLLTVVIPKLEQWRNEGVTGQKKITQTTRYVTLVLAVLQGTTFAVIMQNGAASLGLPTNTPLIVEFTVPYIALIVLTMTAGTALVMWMGELITQRGIGQGMSILIFTSVVSGIPLAFNSIRLAENGNLKFAAIIVLFLALMVAIIYIEQGQRRIPVQFAKRVVGRRQYAGQSTYIPLKVNPAGIIPLIFASAVLTFPSQIATVFPEGVTRWVNDNLAQPTSIYYILFYGFLIISFTYFYARIQFDPIRYADQVRKQGGYVPGIRPGPATERHLTGILNRLTFPGSIFLAVIALFPSLLLAVWDVDTFAFAGTSILIAVGVALETMKQVDSQLTMRNYEGFLK